MIPSRLDQLRAAAKERTDKLLAEAEKLTGAQESGNLEHMLPTSIPDAPSLINSAEVLSKSEISQRGFDPYTQWITE